MDSTSANSSRSDRINGIESGIEAKPHLFFIVDSAAQAEMFIDIMEGLPEYRSTVMNLDVVFRTRHIYDTLESLHLPYIAIARANVTEIKNLFSREKPKILIIGYDQGPTQRLLITCASSARIPTLLVQDGIMYRTKINRPFDSIKHMIKIPLRFIRFFMNQRYALSDKIEFVLLELKYGKWTKPEIFGHGDFSRIAVFGNATKEMLVSEGVEPEKISVTGNPKFDRLFYDGLHVRGHKERFCKKWSISPRKKMVLLFTQYFVEINTWSTKQRERFVLAIANTVAALQDCELVIKIRHPYESEREYLEITKHLKDSPIICKSEPPHELIGACDLVISVSSTAALEAMTLKKPVLIVNLFDDHSAEFFKPGCAAYATREIDILPAMKNILYDREFMENVSKRVEKFTYDNAYLQDGRATQRIVDLIENMISRNGLG